MADAGRTATKVKSASRKTAARTKSAGAKATSRASRTSAARTSGAKASRARAAGAKTPGGTTTAQRPAARAGTANENRVNVPIPVLTPHLKMLHVPTPGKTYVEDAGRVVAGYLPPPERLAFYGGLGVAAVLGAIDWPVAAAIGVGTMVARRTGRGMAGMAGMGGMRSRTSRQQRSTKR